MKKTLFLLLIPVLANAQLATKAFPKDTLTDLKERIDVSEIRINDDDKTIMYRYTIVTYVPKNNVVVKTSHPRWYMRYNKPGKLEYNQFMNTSAGDTIKARIGKDINKMNKAADVNLLEQ